MKNKLAFVLALMLAFSSVLSVAAYAQVARNASDQSVQHARTNITNLGVTGLDMLGNPGYVALAGVSTKSGYQTEYYLWVDETGDLCIASYATISRYTSFPNGSWNLNNMGAACGKVGSQS